ncbi:hypothetical protein BKI52_14050 [marine bacterium AO1-C]|nr:hypothetical protein BKI52_14050 [marine bacterium AO1-C]
MKKNYYLFLLLVLISVQVWGQTTYKLEDALKEPTKATNLWISGGVPVPAEIKKLKRVKTVWLFQRPMKLEFPKALLTLDSLQTIDIFFRGRSNFKMPREIVQMRQLKKIKVNSWSALNIEYPKEIKQRPDLVIDDENRATYLRLVVGYQQGVWPVMELGILLRRRNPIVDQGALDASVQFNPQYWSWSVAWEKYITRGLEGYRLMVGNSLFKLGSIYYRRPNERKHNFFAYRFEFGINADGADVNFGYNLAPGRREINKFIFNVRANLAILLFKKIKYY